MLHKDNKNTKSKPNEYVYIGCFRWYQEERRELNHRLYPLYKHEEEKVRFAESDELRRMSTRAAFELGDEFDFDELRIMHYPQRHPNSVDAPQLNILTTN